MKLYLTEMVTQSFFVIAAVILGSVCIQNAVGGVLPAPTWIAPTKYVPFGPEPQYSYPGVPPESFSDVLYRQLVSNNVFRTLFSQPIRGDLAINIALSIAISLVRELGIRDSYPVTNLLSNTFASLDPAAGPDAYGRALSDAIGQILVTNNILNCQNFANLASTITRVVIEAAPVTVLGDVGYNVGSNLAGSGLNYVSGANAGGYFGSVDHLDLGLDSYVDGGANLGAGLNIGGGLNFDLGAGVGGGFDLNAGIGSSANVDIGAAANLDLGFGAGLDIGAGLDLNSGVGANIALGAGLGLNAGAGVGADLGVGAGFGFNAGVGAGADIGANLLGAGLDVGANVGVNANVDVDAGVNIGAKVDVGVPAAFDVDLTVSAEAMAQFKIGLYRELLRDKYFKYVFSDSVPISALQLIASSLTAYLSKAFSLSRSFLMPLESKIISLSSDLTPSADLYAGIIASTLTSLLSSVNLITTDTSRLQVTVAAAAISSGIASFLETSSVPGLGLSVSANVYNSYFSALSGLGKLPYIGIDGVSSKLPPIVITAQTSTFALRFSKTLYYNLVSSNRFSEALSLGVPKLGYKIIANSLGNFVAEAFGSPSSSFFTDIYVKALLATGNKLNYKAYARALSLATTKALCHLGYFSSGNVNVQAAIARNAIIRAFSAIAKRTTVSTQFIQYSSDGDLPWTTAISGVEPPQSLLNVGIGAGLGANVNIGGGVGAEVGANVGIGAGLGANVNIGTGVGANGGLGAGVALGGNIRVGLGGDISGPPDWRSDSDMNGDRPFQNSYSRKRRSLIIDDLDEFDFDLEAELEADLAMLISGDAETKSNKVGQKLDKGIDAEVAAGLGLAIDAGIDVGAKVEAGFGADQVLGIGGKTDAGLGLGFGSTKGLGIGAGFDAGLDLGLKGGLGIGANTGVGAGLGVGLDAGLGIGANTGVGAGLGVGLGGGLGLGIDAGLSGGLGIGTGVRARFSANADVDIGADVDAKTDVDVGKKSYNNPSILTVLPKILAERLYQSTALYTSTTLVGCRKVLNLFAQGIASQYGFVVASVFLKSYMKNAGESYKNSVGLNIDALATATTDALAAAGLLNSTFCIYTVDQLAAAIVAKYSSLIATSLDARDWSMRPRWSYYLEQDSYEPPLSQGYDSF